MGYFKIIRPINCAITFISVLVGAWTARMATMPGSVIIAGVIGFLVCAFGNIVNDLADIEIDRINNPRRPLPAGSIRKKGAAIFSVILAVLSLMFAVCLGLLPVIVVVATLVLLFFYARILKKSPLGNVTVSLIAGLSFIFGGIITKNIFCLIPFIFAVLIHMPREIIKDMIDIEGDRSAGVRSLPILWGEKRALCAACIFLAVLFLLIPLPYLFSVMGIAYLAVVVIGAYPLLVFLIITMLHAPTLKSLRWQSKLIKVVMGVGLIGFLCG